MESNPNPNPASPMKTDSESDSDSGPVMGLTENLSATYLSSGNPCLDFFFHVVPDSPASEVVRILESAWLSDSKTALKLIFNLRGVRGTGKSDREGFYTSAIWLHQNHPKTLALNCKAIAGFGYFKDLPEILYRLLEGSDARKLLKEEWRNRMNRKGVVGPDKETARALRKERELLKAKKAIEKYESDSNYRFLFDSVCGVFAEMLKSDIESLKLGELKKISLASKWCPSVDSSYDKSIRICERIAMRIFPKDSTTTDETRYIFRIRDRLRKEILVPLHRALELPEVFMSAREWNSLPYNRVASVAMKNYKTIFSKRDRDRFEGFLEDVKAGKAKIAAGALLPHEIVKSLNKDKNENNDVAELQWERMVSDLRVKGTLSGCIAVCDVSGSMEGIPMEVSVALGLLVSELSDEPWKGKVITFSESPEIHVIKGDTLSEKTTFIRDMDWGGNTDFQKVFDRLIEAAEAAGAATGDNSKNRMPKRVFVFSDMEFDQACSNYHGPARKWATDYEVIKRKFRERGYGDPPEIVFWNLRHSASTPVTASRPGVALVSGFSKNILTLFVEEGGVIESEKVMKLAISKEEYEKLVVYD